MPLTGIPSWFTVPTAQPRDVGAIPEALRGFPLGAHLKDAVPYPATLTGVMDIPGDDVVPGQGECMTVHSASCPVRSKVGAPVTNGPTGDMYAPAIRICSRARGIYNYKGGAVWPAVSPSLGAFPYEPFPQFGDAGKGSNCTCVPF